MSRLIPGNNSMVTSILAPGLLISIKDRVESILRVGVLTISHQLPMPSNGLIGRLNQPK